MVNKMNETNRMIEIEKAPIEETMLPKQLAERGYEVIRYQCVDDAKDVSAICRTPYGGVAEVRCETDTVTNTSSCPVCASEMKEFRGGLFVCSEDHPALWMATPRYNLERKPTVLQNQRRAIATGRRTPMRVQRRAVVDSQRQLDKQLSNQEVMDSVKSQLEDALGDWI